jgi:hypothetical protein
MLITYFHFFHYATILKINIEKSPLIGLIVIHFDITLISIGYRDQPPARTLRLIGNVSNIDEFYNSCISIIPTYVLLEIFHVWECHMELFCHLAKQMQWFLEQHVYSW